MCTRVGNQRSRGVVTARVQTDDVRSLHHQRRDLHQLTYPVPLRRSGLILLSWSRDFTLYLSLCYSDCAYHHADNGRHTHNK
jgi:hypothetical protein